MPSSHTEITAYIQDGDLRRVANALIDLASREGRRRVDPPQRRGVRYVLQASPLWNVAVLPGAPGWTVVHAQPWNLLGATSPQGTIRFVDLCATVAAPGFLLDVVDEGVHGAMVLETDGHGSVRLGGWYTGHDANPGYHGRPLDADRMTPPSFERFAGLASASGLAAVGHLDLSTCQAIAHEVGGETGARLWSSGEDFSGAWIDVQHAMQEAGAPPVPGAILLQFVE